MRVVLLILFTIAVMGANMQNKYLVFMVRLHQVNLPIFQSPILHSFQMFSRSAQFEHTVLVNKNGVEVLTLDIPNDVRFFFVLTFFFFIK